MAGINLWDGLGSHLAAFAKSASDQFASEAQGARGGSFSHTTVWGNEILPTNYTTNIVDYPRTLHDRKAVLSGVVLECHTALTDTPDLQLSDSLRKAIHTLAPSSGVYLKEIDRSTPRTIVDGLMAQLDLKREAAKHRGQDSAFGELAPR